MGRTRVQCPSCNEVFGQQYNFTRHKRARVRHCGVAADAEEIRIPTGSAAAEQTINNTTNNTVINDNSTTNNTTINNTTINNNITVIAFGSEAERAAIIADMESCFPLILVPPFNMVPSRYVKAVWCKPAHPELGSVVMQNTSKEPSLWPSRPGFRRLWAKLAWTRW